MINFSNCLRNSIRFISYLRLLSKNKFHKSQINSNYSGTIAVLANGPSLKNELPRLNNDDEFRNIDYIVLNFMAFEESFFKIKPKHYCLADPMYFHDTHKKDDVKRLYDIMENKIDWDINIYVPYTKYKNFIQYSGLKNSRINIIKINTAEYQGYESLRNCIYKKGLGMPSLQTVANLAIYVALNSGYSEVRLYGVDHSFFESLCVNEMNQLCNKDAHFYNDDSILLKPIIKTYNDKPIKVSEYLEETTIIFKSHDLLASYAKYLNVRIINCTKDSMIDSYERKSFRVKGN